jgi:hypothetical protein
MELGRNTIGPVTRNGHEKNATRNVHRIGA